MFAVPSFFGYNTTFVSTPVATAATGVGETSFTANWNAFAGAEYYLLDVSTSPSFSSFVLEDEVVLAPTTSYVVIGLTASTTYYYRLRASTDPLLLLDQYPSAAAAYSVRKLRTAYTGSAIRVRRSSDNTEQDIGFTALGNLDESALTSFCGSGNGFVTTWYDQSGNGRNTTQITASAQPKIVNSGNILTKNTKPAVTWDTTDSLLLTGLSLNNSNASIFSVVEQTTENSNGGIVQLMPMTGENDYGSVNCLMLETSSALNRMAFLNNFSNFEIFETGTGPTPYALRTAIRTLSFAQIWKNTVSQANVTATLTSGTSTGILLGQRYFSGSLQTTLGLNGPMQEIVIYLTDQSSNKSGIESNINSYYGIY